MYFTRKQILSELWTRWIPDPRLDGKKAYRELSKYGNLHVVFEKGSEVGIAHWDKINATNQPISHLADFLHEKSGINKDLLRLVGYLGTLYLGYRVGKYITNSI